MRRRYDVGCAVTAHVSAYADVLRLACEHDLRPGGAQLACLLLPWVGRPT